MVRLKKAIKIKHFKIYQEEWKFSKRGQQKEAGEGQKPNKKREGSKRKKNLHFMDRVRIYVGFTLDWINNVHLTTNFFTKSVHQKRIIYVVIYNSPIIPIQ